MPTATEPTCSRCWQPDSTCRAGTCNGWGTEAQRIWLSTAGAVLRRDPPAPPVAWTFDDLHLLEWAEKWQPRVEQLLSLHREGKTLRQERKGYPGSCMECSREDVFVRWPCPTYAFLTAP